MGTHAWGLLHVRVTGQWAFTSSVYLKKQLIDWKLTFVSMKVFITISFITLQNKGSRFNNLWYIHIIVSGCNKVIFKECSKLKCYWMSVCISKHNEAKQAEMSRVWSRAKQGDGWLVLKIPQTPWKWKWKKVKSLSRVRLFADSVDCSPPGSSIHGILQARILEWVAGSFSRRSSWHPGIEHRCPALQADALTSEPPGKLPEGFQKTFLKGKWRRGTAGYMINSGTILIDWYFR